MVDVADCGKTWLVRLNGLTWLNGVLAVDVADVKRAQIS